MWSEQTFILLFPLPFSGESKPIRIFLFMELYIKVTRRLGYCRSQNPVRRLPVWLSDIVLFGYEHSWISVMTEEVSSLSGVENSTEPPTTLNTLHVITSVHLGLPHCRRLVLRDEEVIYTWRTPRTPCTHTHTLKGSQTHWVFLN